jgi:hypothetical protein
MRERKIDVIMLRGCTVSVRSPEPKIPIKIWVMLGVVILFTLLLSYFLVIGVYDIAARGQ